MTKPTANYWVMSVAVIWGMLTGCVPGIEADARQDECIGLIAKPVDLHSRQYPNILKLDFTDDGQYVNRCELSTALNRLTYPAGDPTNAPANALPYINVVFFHGWRHNSAPEDSNLHDFAVLLDSIAKQEQRTSARPRKVMGVFVAWNGKRSHIPVVDFWSRESAADRISQSANVTKLIGSLEHIRKSRQSRDQTVYIGHSFGARILFTSVSQLLHYNVQTSFPENDSVPQDHNKLLHNPVPGVGDLVVLLNPAFEASLFTGFQALRRDREVFSPNQRPLVLCIGTENDWPNILAFPTGHLLRFNNFTQRTTTLGNYEPYQTHTLRLAEDAPGESQNDTIMSLQRFRHGGVVLDSLSLPRAYGGTANTNIQHANNPFLVAHAESRLIDGHGGIWDHHFRDWLVAYLAAIDRQKRQELAHTSAPAPDLRFAAAGEVQGAVDSKK